MTWALHLWWWDLINVLKYLILIKDSSFYIIDSGHSVVFHMDSKWKSKFNIQNINCLELWIAGQYLDFSAHPNRFLMSASSMQKKAGKKLFISWKGPKDIQSVNFILISSYLPQSFIGHISFKLTKWLIGQVCWHIQYFAKSLSSQAVKHEHEQGQGNREQEPKPAQTLSNAS